MRKLITSLLVAAVPMAASAGVVVDGNLFSAGDDWAINPANLKSANPNVSYTVEDHLISQGDFLFPGGGGQDYDAEGLYVQVQGGKLYIGMITGYSPNNQYWAPGDFLLDFGTNGSYDYAIVVNNTNLNFGEQSKDKLPGRANLDVGGVYGISNQSQLLYSGKPTNPAMGLNCGVQSVGGTTLVAATYDCSQAPISVGEVAIGGPVGNLGVDPNPNDKHYMWEVAVDLASFGDDWGQSFKLHWVMHCGNDVIEVPAPGTLALIGLSMLGLGMSRRRK